MQGPVKFPSDDLNDHIRYAMPDELAAIRNISHNLNGNSNVVMLGAGPGVMALAVLEGQSSGIVPATFWVVDNEPKTFWYMEQHIDASKLLSPVMKNERFFMIVGDSAKVGEGWSGEVDFLIVDADHSEEGVLKDIDAWWPKVKRGGTALFHDFLERPGGFDGPGEWAQGGVARAIEQRNKDWYFVKTVGISIVYRKP